MRLNVLVLLALGAIGVALRPVQADTPAANPSNPTPKPLVVVFLSEGYTSKAAYDSHLTELKGQLVGSAAYQTLNRLRPVRIIERFVPTTVDGITSNSGNFKTTVYIDENQTFRVQTNDTT